MARPAKSEIENRCAALREALGISAAQLAAEIGVTRQTIYSIEAGRYLPSAIIALRLARALHTTVEELFRLSDPPETAAHSPDEAFLLSNEPLRPGQSVQLARVGRRLVASPPPAAAWYLPPADAIVAESSTAHKTLVQPFHPAQEIANRIVIAGCDPGMSILARHARAAGIELVLVHRNSTQSLELLQRDTVHIAGSHLHDNPTERSPSKRSMAVVSFAWWEVGFVTAPRNPKKIRTVEDLDRPDVLLRNREPGSGARAFLDAAIQALGLRSTAVRGYSVCAQGHLDAAHVVSTGEVDCCIATRAAAQRFGLGFVPLGRERYDFVLRRRELATPAIRDLLDLIAGAKLRRELGMLGYESVLSGQTAQH